MTRFSIRAVPNGPQCELVLVGEVDLQVADALVRVGQSHLADACVQRVLVNLGAVTFMDSTGLGALVAIRNEANRQGKEAVIGNVPERIRKLLEITGLDVVFAINSNIAPPAKPEAWPPTDDRTESDAPTDPQQRIVTS